MIRLTPDDLILMQNQQEMMTNPELSAYIDRQKARGLSNTKEFEIEYRAIMDEIQVLRKRTEKAVDRLEHLFETWEGDTDETA